ncbi:MAG: DUF6817 domain-containing protein, partial [Thermodesulfobacteriota bacterium]
MILARQHCPILPEDLYTKALAEFQRVPLRYGWKSHKNSDAHGHWNVDLVGGNEQNSADLRFRLNGENGCGKDIIDHLTSAAAYGLKDKILIRCYINGYTYGTEGYFHADSRRDDETTVVIYLCREWVADWAGETVFLSPEPDGGIAQAVLPRRNLGVVFDSKVLHAARGVSRKCNDLRLVFVAKFRDRRDEDYELLCSYLLSVGATDIRHTSGSLHDHLMATFELIRKNRSVLPGKETAFAGGLHSVFGTNAFSRGPLILTEGNKRNIVEKFGYETFFLASSFGLLNRPYTLE